MSWCQSKVPRQASQCGQVDCIAFETHPFSCVAAITLRRPIYALMTLYAEITVYFFLTIFARIRAEVAMVSEHERPCSRHQDRRALRRYKIYAT